MIALTNPVDLSEATHSSGAQARRDAALDERGLEQLLAECGGQVKGALMGRYRTAFGAADVDDILAIAVERVWRNRKRFDACKGTLKAWFFRIADNTARDVLRYGWFKARKLEIAVEQGALEALVSQRDPAAGVDDSRNGGDGSSDGAGKTRDEARQVLLEGLGRLPELQRRILWADALSPSGPVPTVDLARELNLSRGTIRVYRAKALARLRKDLGDHPLFACLQADQPQPDSQP